MKFINNTIDTEYLQESISDADLETQMANCEVKSEVFNGHHAGGIKTLDKTKMESVEVAKLSNGIHEKSGSPTKCNGKVNGFYEEEEDFNLVLEDSSEGGESPLKKIDDDSISAPQIVQQIEDLLGITSSSAGIQEELNNLDGTESMEDNLDNVEDIEDNQDIEEVFERTNENKIEVCQEVLDKKEITEEIKKQLDKNTETTTESDTSSHMNLVFDEIEVGNENCDSSISNDCNLNTKSDNTESKVGSTTEDGVDKVKDLIANENKDTNNDDVKDNNIESDNVSSVNNSLEIPLTQSSSVSGNSEEWMVLDSIETSDEEKLPKNNKPPKSMGNLVGDLDLCKPTESKDGSTCETNCALSTQDDELPNESLPLPPNSSESKESKSFTNCNLSEQDDGTTHLKQLQATVISETKPTTTFLCEGDGARKRCASIDEEDVELKKPKLEDQSSSEECSSPVLKRPSSVTTESESKRTKLSESSEECETPGDKESQVNEKSESINEKSENTCLLVESEIITDNQTSDILSSEEKSTSEEPLKRILAVENEESHSIASCSRTENVNDEVQSSSVTEQTQDKLMPDVSAQCDDDGGNIDFISSKESILSLDDRDTTTLEDTHSLTTVKQSETSKEENLNSEDLKSMSKNESQNCEEETVSDENKDKCNSIIDTSKEEGGFKLDDLTSINTKESSNSEHSIKTSEFPTKTENKIIEVPKEQVSMTKELSTSIKELEKSLINSGHDKIQGSRDLKGASQGKKMTNLDLAIERAVEKARIQTEMKIPILKKFHKDQLKKLKRTELEDIVVSKICEAVSYKSEIGQMRLRTQSLEETNEMWRKKVQQIEKQNRELEMVLKRFLAELAHIKRENQNKVPMPIKVTRSVGLQVVLASSMHGALVSSRNKSNNESTQQQQQAAKARQLEREKEKIKESVKATTFTPPSQSSLGRGRGRPSKTSTSQNSRPTTPQTLAPKVTPPTTPSKPTTTPIKTILPTPNKDLEVIDLTDKEERAKSTSQAPVSGAIRVAPSTQVCFVQQSTTPSPQQQQPLYLVQKAPMPGQRPQFLVATSSASPQRPISNMSRPTPALALPVFRSSGHLIPVQTSPQVGVKTNANTSPTNVARQVSTTLRIQQPTTVNKHPAPLPSEPLPALKPGMKAPPPKPQLKIAKTSNGIMLSWSMSLSKEMAEMQSYQLYAYQEGNQPPSTGLWKKVGDVKALPLPMACTLTQFIEGHRYHFAVRAKDVHGRIGPFSTPSSILLTK